MSAALREIRVTNTLSGKKEVLKTREPGKISFYSCGPTVYDFIHIGNLRAALTADLFYRTFKHLGYAVTYVRNYTDIDDRIITKANQMGVPMADVTRKYTAEVELDYAVAGLEQPTHKTLVTEHLPEIIAMIQSIVKNGKGYVSDDGEVLFSIEAADHYGKLSHKKIDDLIAGHRVAVSAKKRNPLDFTLWKPAKLGEPSWPSPWGAGRPGWHIECSAMAEKWLGSQMDVHHGGEDLVFPHHENEIAQSEGATGCVPFVGYWLHNAFLTIRKDKMSKSVGNVFQAREFLTRFGGEVARALLLSAHYRTVLDFGPDAVEQAIAGLTRIYEAKARALELKRIGRARADLRAEGAWGEFVAGVEEARREIQEHYANDFNTPGVLACVFGVIRDFNRTLSEPLAQATPSAVLGAEALIALLEHDLASVIGIGRTDPTKALADLANAAREAALLAGGPSAAAGASGSGATRPEATEIEALIAERAQAKAAKDYARADAIRKDLEARGVALKDSPQGTRWSYT